MSGHYPPLDCKTVKRALLSLGFRKDAASSGTSHEHYSMLARGERRRVTVDCPKAPFSQFLIGIMAMQAGLTKKELYQVVGGGDLKNWP